MLHTKRLSASSRRRHLRVLARILTRGNANAVRYFRSLLKAFAAQRISVAVHIAAAQEIAEALGLSVAADPRE